MCDSSCNGGEQSDSTGKGVIGSAAAFLSDLYPTSAVSGPLRLEVILCLKASDISAVHECIQCW